MSDRMPPELELLPDGSYRPRRPPVAARIFAWAMVIAVVAAALALAAFALWFALILIPVVVVAGLIAWLAFRVQVWRAARRDPWER
jgi:fatty acid desaturase